jgi:hypothetical protein
MLLASIVVFGIFSRIAVQLQCASHSLGDMQQEVPPTTPDLILILLQLRPPSSTQVDSLDQRDIVPGERFRLVRC